MNAEGIHINAITITEPSEKRYINYNLLERHNKTIGEPLEKRYKLKSRKPQ